MDFREGLERINSLWWGFLALLAVAMLLLAAYEQSGELAAMGGAGLVACFAAHRGLRWVIRGFFPVKPSA